MRLRTLRFLTLVTLLAAPAACREGADLDARAQPANVDTVRLLEPAFELESEPVAVTGGAETAGSDPMLHLVRDGVFLSDGAFVVANEASRSIVYFDAGGRFVREVGRDGDGPGEFRRPRSVHRLAGDSIAAWDPIPERITVFDSKGNVARTVSLGSGRKSLFGARSYLDLYQLGAHGFAAVTDPLGRQAHERRGRRSRDEHFIALVDAGGNTAVELGVVRGIDWFRHGNTAGPAVFSYRFFPATTTEAFYLGHGRGPELIEYGLDARVRARLLLPIERKFMSAADLDGARRRWVARMHPRNRESEAQRFYDRVVVDSFPAFTDLESTSAGSTLWMQLYDLPDQPRRWLIVNPAERTARRIVLPPRAQVLDASDTTVLILTKDSFDVEVVAVHRFRIAS